MLNAFGGRNDVSTIPTSKKKNWCAGQKERKVCTNGNLNFKKSKLEQNSVADDVPDDECGAKQVQEAQIPVFNPHALDRGIRTEDITIEPHNGPLSLALAAQSNGHFLIVHWQ